LPKTAWDHVASARVLTSTAPNDLQAASWFPFMTSRKFFPQANALIVLKLYFYSNTQNAHFSWHMTESFTFCISQNIHLTIQIGTICLRLGIIIPSLFCELTAVHKSIELSL